MGYSYRFYGRAPAHWHEGANLGHGYELQFARKVTAPERARLAATYERMLQFGPADPSPEPWLWSDERFALFHVGERFPSAAPMVFAKVTDFLMEARTVCPLRDVVYWNAAEPGGSRWDAWTVASQPLPDPGPPYPFDLDERVLLYPRDRSGDLPVAAPDEAFEDARAAARSAIVRDKAAQASASGGLALTPVDERPDEPQWPDEIRAEFDLWSPDDLLHLGPRPCAYRRNERGEINGFAYLDDGGQLRSVTIETQGYPGTAIAMHPDGSRGLCCIRNLLLEIDFGDGQARERWTAPWEEKEIQGLGYLAGGAQWAVKTGTMLHVVDPSGDEPALVASAKSKGTNLGVGRQGTILVTSQWGKAPQVFGFAEQKLKKLAAFKLQLHFREAAGHIYLFCGDDTFRLDRVDETHEAFAAALRKKAEKARLQALGIKPKGKGRAKKTSTKKKAKKKAKPTIGIQWGGVTTMPETTPAQRREEARDVHGPSGAAAVYQTIGHADEPWLGYERIIWTDASGVELTLDLPNGRDLCLSPTGTIVVAATGSGIFRIERADGEPKMILASGKGEHMKQVCFMGDKLLALSNKRLYLLDPTATGGEGVIHKLGATHGYQLVPIPEREAVVVTRENKGLDVVAIVGDKLKKLGKVDDPLQEVAWKDGTLYVWDHLGGRTGVASKVIELVDA